MNKLSFASKDIPQHLTSEERLNTIINQRQDGVSTKLTVPNESIENYTILEQMDLPAFSNGRNENRDKSNERDTSMGWQGRNPSQIGTNTVFAKGNDNSMTDLLEQGPAQTALLEYEPFTGKKVPPMVLL